MCGIFGLLSRTSAPLDRAQCLRALSLLAHRGPDGAGLALNDRLALGHTRLSIVDPEGGAQPHLSADGRVTVVCNGEIYNAPELRAWLQSKGYRLQTACDTEVIPHLYLALGHNFVERLSGMFAFLLYDANRQVVLAGRDRLGIKPLSMAVTDGAVVFASEAKAILGAGYCTAALNPAHISQTLVLGYGLPNADVFEGIARVPPGALLTLPLSDPANISIHRYWSAESIAEPYGEPADEDELRTTLDSSVRRHLIGDVPFACYLSGGIDSTFVTQTAQLAASGREVTALTLSFADSAFNEAEEAAAYARQAGLRLHLVEDRAWTLDDLAAATASLEAPQIVTLDLSMRALSAATRDLGVKFVLGGDGADEVFGGYDHFALNRVQRFTVTHVAEPAAAAAMLAFGRAALGYPADVGFLQIDPQAKGALAVYTLPWQPIWNQNARIAESLVPGSAEAVLGDGGDVLRFLEDGLPTIRDAAPIRQAIAVELATRLPGWILPRTDANSMANGIEARVPFLDPEILALMARVPDHALDVVMAPKGFLRRAVAPTLPAEVARRQKRAFNTSNRWLWHDAQVRDLIEAPQSGFFEPAALRRLHNRVIQDQCSGEVSLHHGLRAQTLVGAITTELLHATCWGVDDTAAAFRDSCRVGLLP